MMSNKSTPQQNVNNNLWLKWNIIFYKYYNNENLNSVLVSFVCNTYSIFNYYITTVNECVCLIFILHVIEKTWVLVIPEIVSDLSRCKAVVDSLALNRSIWTKGLKKTLDLYVNYYDQIAHFPRNYVIWVGIKHVVDCQV